MTLEQFQKHIDGFNDLVGVKVFTSIKQLEDNVFYCYETGLCFGIQIHFKPNGPVEEYHDVTEDRIATGPGDYSYINVNDWVVSTADVIS